MTNTTNIQAVWEKYEERLDHTRNLNLALLKEINIHKAKSKLRSLIWIAGITLAFYQLVMWFMVGFIWNYWMLPHYLISGIALVIWAGLISIGAVRQLQLILSIDYAQPVLTVQKSLQKVKLAIIHFMRWSLMILPFWFTFLAVLGKVFFDIDFFALADPVWILVQLIVLIIPAIWIYRNFSPKNAHKKWLNWLLQGNGSQITEAQQLIKEIERFELQN